MARSTPIKSSDSSESDASSRIHKPNLRKTKVMKSYCGRRTATIRALDGATQRRPLIVRSDFKPRFPANLPANLESALAQIAGAETRSPCRQCKNKTGPWIGCITTEGLFNGSCANCHYENRAWQCSFISETPSPQPDHPAQTFTFPTAPATSSIKRASQAPVLNLFTGRRALKLENRRSSPIASRSTSPVMDDIRASSPQLPVPDAVDIQESEHATAPPLENRRRSRAALMVAAAARITAATADLLQLVAEELEEEV